jgi:hypothetical protein
LTSNRRFCKLGREELPMDGSSHRWSRGVILGVALLLPFKAGGCGRTACITVDPDQFGAGTCPLPSDADSRFGGCVSEVSKVDGTGVRDGNLCCYPVVMDGHVAGDCNVVDTVDAGQGAGIGSGPDECVTCLDLLNGGIVGSLCTSSGLLLMDLVSCACSSSCASACQSTLCGASSPNPACMGCLNEMGTGGCGPQLVACRAI